MRRWWWQACAIALVPVAVAGLAAGAVSVEQFSPQGTVKNVRQVTARFSAPMVPFGDLRDVADPFAVECAESGTARWVDSRTWAFDFARDLPAGIRCAFTVREGLRSVDGQPVSGATHFAFTTGGPAVTGAQPSEGSERIDEEQAFVLSLDGEATPDSVRAHAAFEVDGIANRIGVELIEGAARDEIIKQLPSWLKPDGPAVLLRARQAFPNHTAVRLIWGAGIASPSGVVTEQDQVLEFRTRRRFTAKVGCARENAKANCVPFSPISVTFSAPVSWELAKQTTLTGGDGAPRAPRPPSDPNDTVTSIEFAPPFPESATFTLTLPADLRDDAGRPLANRDDPAFTVKTAPYPPLAKFAARFGILEAKADPALPVTIRNLDPQVEGQELRVTKERASGWGAQIKELYGRLTGSVARVAPEHPEELLPWLRRLAVARRDRSMFDDVTLPPDQTLRPFTLPQPDGPQAMQVVGLPFDAPGFYLVQLESPRLGAALLGADKSMFVPAGALVTNLAVHLKWAHENALVWVTTLDDAKPVEGARVEVRDCNDTLLASGVTDAQGIARFTGLPDQDRAPRCEREADFADWTGIDYSDYYANPALTALDGGLFVTAQTDGDLSFVHSSWRQGIETWRFHLPDESWQAPLLAHTVFDRTLFRAGDTVHMKHVLRVQTLAGFGLVADGERPTTTIVRHLGSNETYELPLAWDANGLAEQAWPIPPAAKLGQYEVALKNAEGREWTSGSFRLEQFRVPLMKATVQLPAEPQIGVTTVPVDVAVQYLAGGAAADLPVVVRAQIRDGTPPSLPDFERMTVANGRVKEGLEREDESEEEEPAGEEQTPGVHQRRELVLDGAGTAHTEITELPAADTVRELLTEVEYRDPNGETQTTAAKVPLWPAALLPGIQAENWAGRHDGVAATVVVVDPRGRPLPGALVRVDAFRRRYYSHRKRLVGGFYGYEHIEETNALGTLCEGTTDGEGLLRCSAPAPAQGDLILQATVTDADGRSAAAHTDVFVSGENDGFPTQASDRIDLLPEKHEYEPGETARFQVRMPFQQATALVTVEREGIGEAWVVPLAATDPVIEVPVRGDHAPNIFVSALVVRGRVGDAQPTAMVDLGKPAFKLGIAEIRVGWRDHTLQVNVSADRPTYHVRDTATVQIAVKDGSGAPPPPGSEVALAAVDEGLLELMPNTSWNLLDAMMGRRGYEVRTATAQTEVIGKRHFGRKALPHGGGGGRQTTRELFDTLLLWAGRVPLDAQGNATVQVPLNDSLTSFRITAVATGASGLFGTGATTIRSTQDLMLLGGLPPLVRQGDRFPAQFTLRNTTDHELAVLVHGSIAVAGRPPALPLNEQSVTLAAGAAQVVEWPVTAPTEGDSLRYLVQATAAGGVTDELAVSQQVREAVPERTLQATLLRWEQPLTQPVQRPADALPGRGGIVVSGAASLGGSTATLDDWLRHYRYSCLEQQVSIAVGLRDAERWQQILAALPSSIDGDGLLKYFPTLPQGSEVLTAYVLSITSAAGWEMPPTVRERLVAGLQGFVGGSVNRDSVLRAPDLTLRKLAALAALARVAAVEPAQLDSIAIEPNLWPTSAVLDWWTILQRTPAIPARDARLAAVEQIVRARLNLQGTTMGFSTDDADALYWLMASADANAMRLIVHLVEFNLWHDDVPRLLRGALARQERGAWATTVANAWGSIALQRFAAAFESTPVTGVTTAALLDASQSLTWGGAPPPPVRFDWPAQAAPLRIDHQGTGNPWLTIASRAAIPLTAPLSSGYRITKTVTPLEPRTAGQLNRGDRLRVHLEIDAQSDMTWVVVDDPIPAGASHLGTGLARDSQIDAGGGAESEALTPDYVERRFDAFRAYYQFVPKGRFTAEYVVRLNQSGDFSLPPTHVEALYAPEMFGEMPNPAVRVEP